MRCWHTTCDEKSYGFFKDGLAEKSQLGNTKDFSIEGAVVPGLLLCLSKTYDCCNCCSYCCSSVYRVAVLCTGKASFELFALY